MDEKKLRKALNHAWTQGAMVGIGQTGVLNEEKTEQARGKLLDKLRDATIPEMRRNTEFLLVWLKRG